MMANGEYKCVSEEIVSSNDWLSALNALDGQQLKDLVPAELRSRGRSHSLNLTLTKRVRANSVGATGGSASHSTASSIGCMSDDVSSVEVNSSDGQSEGGHASSSDVPEVHTPPTRALKLSSSMMRSRLSPQVTRQQQLKAALKVQVRHLRMQEAALRESLAHEEDEDAHAGELTKSAGVAAALMTFVMAMLSCPLGPCLPPTHIHLSRLPIGTGHNLVIDALRREWADHEFDIKLHVYQKTRHVSGVATITPGLQPDEVEAIRTREGQLYLPLADSGDKMIVEESKRDRDPDLYMKYKHMVLQGLGMHVEGAEPLTVTEPEVVVSPIVYLRVMADRTQGNGLLTCVSDIKDEGLIYILDRFTYNGTSLSESVKLVAPDKSANRQHMHRSHFGRAYFLECVDEEHAYGAMRAIQKDSVQIVDGMRFSLHVEMKKGAKGANGEDSFDRLFEQDPQKRQQVEKRLENAKAVASGLVHRPCGCALPERHTMAMHTLFAFKGCRTSLTPVPAASTYAESTVMGDNLSVYNDNMSVYNDNVSVYNDGASVSMYADNVYGDNVSVAGYEVYGEGAYNDTMSVAGTEYEGDYELFKMYESGYNPRGNVWWNPNAMYGGHSEAQWATH